MLLSARSRCVKRFIFQTFSDSNVPIYFFQALVPFAASPAFGFLYKDTVATFPAAFLILIACIKGAEAILIAYINIGMRREEKKILKNKEELQEGKEMQMKNGHPPDVLEKISEEGEEVETEDPEKEAAKKLMAN